ncbi:MAG: hypothetical protein IPJ08_23610 [Burkholderiales bacterium]|nr:hypothetical protein [Burkholderiales bacterium]MBP6677224.1 hypothetical protein [Vitreoscilla sp.]
MNPNTSPALAVVLLAALATAGCGSTDTRTGAAVPSRPDAMPVQAALIFSGPFRWVERDKAFEGAPGPVGLDQPLRPLATLHRPSCPAKPANRPAGPTVLTDRLAKPAALCSATVRFGIAADGRVSHTQLIHAAQSEGVDPSFNFGFNVVTNVNQWRFEPPLRGGKPADICCVELTIN